MMERVTMYQDEERATVTEIRERFRRRKDALRERRVYPMQETTIVRKQTACTEGFLMCSNILVEWQKEIWKPYS